MGMNDEERQRQRELLAKEEKEMKERQLKGIRDFAPSEKERALLERIGRLSALAKSAAKMKVAVKAFDDKGELTTVEERVGLEDMIFMELLRQRLSDREEGSR